MVSPRWSAIHRDPKEMKSFSHKLSVMCLQGLPSKSFDASVQRERSLSAAAHSFLRVMEISFAAVEWLKKLTSCIILLANSWKP
jgi:hypothetical protein